MAIAKIRQFYAENRENCKFDEGELCQKILNNVIGFDLNPLAVISARTNYMMAIADLLKYKKGEITIPIYLCDSIKCRENHCPSLRMMKMSLVSA